MGNISFPEVQQLIYSVPSYTVIQLYCTRVNVVFLTLAIYSSYCKDYRQ